MVQALNKVSMLFAFQLIFRIKQASFFFLLSGNSSTNRYHALENAKVKPKYFFYDILNNSRNIASFIYGRQSAERMFFWGFAPIKRKIPEFRNKWMDGA